MPRADLGHGCSHPGVDIASIRLVWSGYHGQSITAVGTVATINGQVPAYLSLGRAVWMHGCTIMGRNGDRQSNHDQQRLDIHGSEQKIGRAHV